MTVRSLGDVTRAFCCGNIATSAQRTSGLDYKERAKPGVHPFDISLLPQGLALEFTAQGGSRDHQFADDTDGYERGWALRLGWRQRATDGFFTRAETFFNFASSLRAADRNVARYGGESLHRISHGKRFCRFSDIASTMGASGSTNLRWRCRRRGSRRFCNSCIDSRPRVRLSSSSPRTRHALADTVGVSRRDGAQSRQWRDRAGGLSQYPMLMAYPNTTSRDFGDILRNVDSAQPTATYRVATPVNRKNNETSIIAGSVSNESAKTILLDGWQELKPSLPIVPQPGW